jgi:hypothetical protein
MRRGQRNRDESGVQSAQERGDVVHALRHGDHGAVAGRSVCGECEGDVDRPPVDLRPRQRLGQSGRVAVVAGVGVRHVMGLQACSIAQ